MDIKERFELIKKNTIETITEAELAGLIKTDEKLRHYIGFEISGEIHLGTGLMAMSKVKDFMEAGIDCSIFLADWHSWINDKLGGNIEIIKKIAIGYFKEGLRASLECVGGDAEKLKFVLGTDLYHNNDDYWATVVEISKNTTLARIIRSITIMGRKEGEMVNFAQLLYPPMQVADIFIQGINIAHAGIDQRKAHVIARDTALNLKIRPLLDKNGKKIKPIAIHHPLILGLGKPPTWPTPKEGLQELWSALKMSKSKPNTCVFIHDSPEEIKKKIEDAFCLPKDIDFNPVLNWAKLLIFQIKKELEIKRPEKYGGDIILEGYAQLEQLYKEGKIHPLDLKNAIAESIIEILEPARKHFSKPKIRKLKEELEELKITH